MSTTLPPHTGVLFSGPWRPAILIIIAVLPSKILMTYLSTPNISTGFNEYSDNKEIYNFGLVKLETCQLCCDFITSLPTCGELPIFGFCNRSYYGIATTTSIGSIMVQRMVIRWASFVLQLCCYPALSYLNLSVLASIRLDPLSTGPTESPPIADNAT